MNLIIDTQYLFSIIKEEEIIDLNEYVSNLICKYHKYGNEEIIIKISGIKTNEDYTLISVLTTRTLSLKTRVKAKTSKEAIKKLKTRLTKDIERNRTKL